MCGLENWFDRAGPAYGRAGLLKNCALVDTIAMIVTIAFGAGAVVAGLVSLLMLRAMMVQHRERMIKLRRGDWSPIPRGMRNLPTKARERSDPTRHFAVALRGRLPRDSARPHF